MELLEQVEMLREKYPDRFNDYTDEQLIERIDTVTKTNNAQKVT